MKVVQQTFTVTSAKQQIVTSPTPACKISAQMVEGGSARGWIGLSTMSNAGADAVMTLPAATASTAGTLLGIETQDGWNALDVSQYYVHGANAGDKVTVTYHQS